MYKKITRILFIAFISFIAINAQAQEKENPNYEKAIEIIKQLQKIIYKNIKRENIKSIYLKSSGDSVSESINQMQENPQSQEFKSRQTIEEDISLEFTDKMNQTVFSYNADKNPAENFTKIKTVLNGDKFSFDTDLINDGKRIDMDAIYNSPFMSEAMKKQMKEAQEKAKPTKEKIQKGIAARMFPILLDMDWMNDKKFIYVGKADSGDTKADILEIETNTERQTRYFFDEKTHLLLMITDEISKDDRSSKSTTYFSDYQLVDGLLIAKKTNNETESAVDNIEMEMMGQKMKMSSKAKTVSETIIKEFKINPTFKPEIFAVKENK